MNTPKNKKKGLYHSSKMAQYNPLKSITINNLSKCNSYLIPFLVFHIKMQIYIQQFYQQRHISSI